MNDKSFPALALSGNGNIDDKTGADNLILILKTAGGVMIAETIKPDEDESGRETCPEPGCKDFISSQVIHDLRYRSFGFIPKKTR